MNITDSQTAGWMTVALATAAIAVAGLVQGPQLALLITGGMVMATAVLTMFGTLASGHFREALTATIVGWMLILATVYLIGYKERWEAQTGGWQGKAWHSEQPERTDRSVTGDIRVEGPVQPSNGAENPTGWRRELEWLTGDPETRVTGMGTIDKQGCRRIAYETKQGVKDTVTACRTNGGYTLDWTP